MANCLPMETIRTGCQVVSIEFDPITQYSQLVLSNGSILQAKVCPVKKKTVPFPTLQPSDPIRIIMS